MNEVWGLDFPFDATCDGRPIKALAMCDEFTRESIGGYLGRSITANDVVKILDAAKAKRGAPEFVRFDNGPEFIASAIRDWCRSSDAGAVYIQPGSPCENPFVESFIGKARDELFDREVFHSVFEARVLESDWRDVFKAGGHVARSATSRPRYSRRCSQQANPNLRRRRERLHRGVCRVLKNDQVASRPEEVRP